MEKTVYRIALLFDILLFLMIGTQMLRYWFDPFLWGWPSEIHPRVYNLLAVEVVTITLFILMVGAIKAELLVKTIALFALFVVNFVLFVFFSFVNPFQRYAEPLALQQGLDAAQFELLDPCKRVEMFAEVAGESVNPWFGHTSEPSWMHESLEKIPQETISICIADEIKKNTSVVASQNTFSEEAVTRIYAVTIEASRLQVVDQPDVLHALKVAVCTRNADPFGYLALQYYPTVNGYLPDYYYHSSDGKEKLHDEICGGE